jgi:hypothetical protein
MHIEFTPTLEELQEAISPKPAPQRSLKLSRPSQPSYGKGLFGWILFVVLAVMLIFLRKLNQHTTAAPGPSPSAPTAPPPVPQPAPQDLLATLLPTLFPAVVFAAVLIALYAHQRAKPTPDPAANVRRQQALAKLAGILFALLIIGPFLALLVPSLTIPWRPTREIQVLVGFAPWFAFVFFTLYLFRPGSATRIQWNSKPSLRAPRTVDADPDALTIASDLATYRFRWPHFVSFRETPTLFILVTRDNELHVFPKRAFPDDPSLDLFRGLLHNSIPTGTTLPPTTAAAFPVLPTATRHNAQAPQ